MSLLSRIDDFRTRSDNISINKLEKACGLTRGSMCKWDEHTPSYDKVKKVADYFGVSAEYLLYGETINTPSPKIEGEIGRLSAEEKELVLTWRTINQGDRMRQLDYLHFLAKGEKDK